jgi:hypothetical protein
MQNLFLGMQIFFWVVFFFKFLGMQNLFPGMQFLFQTCGKLSPNAKYQKILTFIIQFSLQAEGSDEFK